MIFAVRTWHFNQLACCGHACNPLFKRKTKRKLRLDFDYALSIRIANPPLVINDANITIRHKINTVIEYEWVND